ncbi:hypothetical protein [Nocardiopsis halotolerans]|uniref:hypothetical protein n=1 Tax=Nocardiopsis halotolerans TaxID=124252 RepID=UPI000348328C|nr:hypothetical protein [Nocardiopsis halotolerans]
MSTAPGNGLLDAGLASPDTPADAGADTVRARSYTHPSLAGRTVVRLVPDTLAPAEDTALDFLGFATGEPSEPLALARQRGLGYPEWALVHDPGSRSRALALVRPMERAARLAASKPGAAADEFDHIAEDVPLPHLPAYWEQAGRAFVAADNARVAAVMFGRAREAERVYGLPVDETTRRESFLEFAFAGALTVRALAGHATELAERYDPARAHAEFRELSLRRTLGGLPPWTGLPKQMRTLARAAGLDPQTEETALLRELLDVPATSSAPEGFWKAVRRSLVVLGRSDADAARSLLRLFVSGDTGFQEWWLELLDDAGAVDLLADPGQPVPGGAASWLSRMVSHCQGWRRSMPARLMDVVARVADRLRADGEPVHLEGDGRTGEVSPTLLDLCLELGVPVHEPDRVRLDLGAWVRGEGGPRRDLAWIRSHPVWESHLAEAVVVYGVTHHPGLEDLLAHDHLHPYVDRRLGELIGDMTGAGLVEAETSLERLRREAGGAVFRAFPERRAQLETVDVAEAFATTLRAGLLGEYGWEALEEAARELGATDVWSGTRPRITSTASWPVLTLSSRTRAIAVGPQGRVAEHDLRLPPGAEEPVAVYADGAFLVAYRDSTDYYGDRSGYWSTDPGTKLSFRGSDNAPRHWSEEDRSTGPARLTTDGARMGGRRAIRAGDVPDRRDLRVFSDGHTHWVLDGHPNWIQNGRTLYEVDPATGDRGRASLPAFLEEHPLTEGEELVPGASSLVPLPEPTPDSPVGGASGFAGFAVAVTRRGAEGGVYRVTDTDGRSVSVPTRYPHDYLHRGAPVGLFTAPGGATHALSTGGGGRITLHTAGGFGEVWSCYPGDTGRCTARWGTPYLPGPLFLHFMRVRDARASARLRAVDADDVAALLEAALAEEEELQEIGPGPARPWSRAGQGSNPFVRSGAGVGEPERTRAAAAALLSGGSGGNTPHDGLVWNVTGMAYSAARLWWNLDDYVAEIARDAERVQAEPDPEHLSRGLARFLPGRTTSSGDTRAHIEVTSRFLRGDIGTEEVGRRPRGGMDWEPLVGRIGALAWYAALPTTGADERDALGDFLGRWAGTVFADRGVTLDTGGLTGADDPETGTEELAPLAGEGARRVGTDLCTRFRTDTDDHVRVDRFVELHSGTPLPVKAPHAEHERHRADLAWGDTAQLTALTTALAQSGPVPWDPAAAELLARRTGLPRAAAVLLLSAHRSGDARRLTTHTRRLLGLSTVDVDLGGRELDGLSGAELLDLYRDALPSTPEGITALWEPGGTLGVAERLAEAWNARFGSRLALAEDTLSAFQTAKLDRVPTDGLRLLADHTTEAALSRDASCTLDVRYTHYNHPFTALVQEPEETGDLDDVVADLAHLIPWAYAELPAGDPVREGIPAALAVVRERLRAPELLFKAAQLWNDNPERLLEAVGGHPYRGANGETPFPASADNGTAVLTVGTGGEAVLWFRPAELGTDVRSRVLRGLVAEDPGYAWHGVLAEVDLLLGADFSAIAERISSGELAEGAHEYDPAACVPDLLAEAARELGLSPDAARLYLQLLTVLEPTDRRVRAVNGWTPARHRRAQAELLETDLVLTAKRARAGRSVFVPGPWTDAQAPNLPYEAWKLPLYDLADGSGGLPFSRHVRHQPTRPLPDLFTEAWKRFRGGDRPGL